MSRVITLSLDQFYRPQPGGIATYVRGLVRGLRQVGDEELELRGVVPRGQARLDPSDVAIASTTAPLSLSLLTRAWARWPLGVARDSDVVHANSVAGPYAGGRPGAVHSVALHDLLWRDEPGSSTARGVRFHESRLRLLRRSEDVRIFASSPGLAARLINEGFDAARVHEVRLGADDDTVAESVGAVRSALASHGVPGPFTLYVGTREPRKNLERLLAAHASARAEHLELGPLVIVGPQGWGGVSSGDAVILGMVPRATLRGLYRDATVVAYVPIAEGFGLPPVEALFEGTRVVASTVTPSVSLNEEVVRVEAVDVDAIAAGLVRALELDDGEAARGRRRASVSTLTWRNVALDHLAGWQ